MWKRNLLLSFTILGAMALVITTLVRGDHIEEKPAQTDFPLWHDASLWQTVTRLDREFAQAWAAKGLKPAPPADQKLVMRRIALGLMGTVPSLEEQRVFESLPNGHRMPWWLAHVFADRRYADYVAERLTRAYVGTEEGPFIFFRRRRFRAWLSDQLHENVPYDQIARQLLVGRGIWTSDPSVNFLSVTVNPDEEDDPKPDPIRLAGRTARAMLGMRIDCLQCHNDKLGNVELGPPGKLRDGEQADFHRLAAFFSEADVSLLGVVDRPGMPYRYKFLHKEQEEVVHPMVPYGQEWLRPAATRRQQLADWVTDPRNRPFARAIVNRAWALLFGKPLVEPIDDIPLYGPFPPGMETLTDDFIEHGYNVRRLLTIIAASEAFQRDSRASFEITPEHFDAWAAFPLVRLRPDQVVGAITQSCSLTTLNQRTPILLQLIQFGDTLDFITRYGDMGEDEFTDRGGTIPQRLLMMNGKVVHDWTADDLMRNASGRIAALAPDDATAVEAAYLCVLTRSPSEAERNHFVERLADHENRSRQQVIEDLFWVLLNSTEFSWNH